VGFEVTDHSLIKFYIRQILEKKKECNETVHQLFVDFKNTYDSVWEGIIVQYFHRVWGTPERSLAD
jgi:hypothetical protein